MLSVGQDTQTLGWVCPRQESSAARAGAERKASQDRPHASVLRGTDQALPGAGVPPRVTDGKGPSIQAADGEGR